MFAAKEVEDYDVDAGLLDRVVHQRDLHNFTVFKRDELEYPDNTNFNDLTHAHVVRITRHLLQQQIGQMQ